MGGLRRRFSVALQKGHETTTADSDYGARHQAPSAEVEEVGPSLASPLAGTPRPRHCGVDGCRPGLLDHLSSQVRVKRRGPLLGQAGL